MVKKEWASSMAIIDDLAEEDIPQLREIGLRIPEFAVGTETPSFYSEEALRRMSQSPESIVLVAKTEDEIAGFILVSILTAARDAYIHTIAVMEEFRKQGLGTMLLEKALAEIKSRQPEINHIFADVEIENVPSLALFENSRFKIGKKFRYVDLMLTNNQ